MAVLVSRKKQRLSKKLEADEVGFLCLFLEKVMLRVPAAFFILAFIYIWSSSTTILSGDIVHVCVSSRKLNNLYCLSAGTQPNFNIVQNSTTTADFGSMIPNIENYSAVGNAYEVVEEQLQLHRSWRSSSSNPTTCQGRGIYVYELPSKFNKDLAAQCHDMIPWLDFCTYLSNGGLGEAVEELGSGWYNTHQYALEPIFHARVLNHPCRVHDASEAKLLYVPYYGGLDVLRWHFNNVTNSVKDALSLDLVRWLQTQSSWYKNMGKDHVLVLGKISWDFRRNERDSWGTRLLELDEMQNPIKLLIERHPWRVNDIGIPHPTFFHPHTDADIVSWQIKMSRSATRNVVVGFAGAARPGSAESIRSVLIEQCTSAGDGECRFLNCTSGQCDRPDSIVGLFAEAEFCLQPPGDSPTRKSVFDSLVAGCIPVLFDPMTAYYQYAWHLPEERDKYSVFIDKEEVRNKSVNVVERLVSIPARERENMRRYIVYELLPGLIYGDLDSKFDKFQDAFSITINSLLESTVSRLSRV
ncbi:xyloglucan-specific galacturonosyltransferase 1-like [Salvia miltiorrhiza]|uniref:xyloglucan-specific galacturonosyltransferase 1-like n=1 Tax=Salvia miltiorrhiza TaxID=226208 RepID=UPI0025AD8005|nr:xyloglucan-specific galacturonosyltransferase 1-like [Salvia miltiorrhiza]